MHVAVTGVTGFIGSYLVRRLKQDGHTISGLVRATSNRRTVEGLIDRFVVGDQADESCWPALLEGADCVIHNSVDFRSYGWGGSAVDLGGQLRSNLVGSIRLLQVSAPRQFIFVSTIAVHHDMRPRGGGLIDEDHPLRPSSLYGAYKAAVEAHLWSEHFGEGRNTCAIRPCGVYGIDPDLSRSYGYNFIEQIRAGKRIEKPGGGKYVHVEDVAAALAAAVGNPSVAGRPYNLVDCYCRWSDMAKYAAEALGVPADIDFSSSEAPKNTFTKDAARSLGVMLDRGHDGIRDHMRELVARMSERGA
jgi:nucleoside-diphosphate-sugar epimerase